ncbi:2500_t:CDS:2 [Ambispora leptoticha]|uniref:2500_t:CDS:1 n=1 Tax=Ambispora leptoticha TaxID=144679 RepID=A0A9N9F4R0_9GLOM|nr:2500_t:CDS:2 [Ambispora leptoticha]
MTIPVDCSSPPASHSKKNRAATKIMSSPSPTTTTKSKGNKTSSTTTNGKKPKLSERDLNIRLTKIFTKIGCLEIASEGIRELYDLLLEHPEYEVKINSFLSSAGTFFYNYIRDALADITTSEMQKCGLLPKEDSAPPSPTPAPQKDQEQLQSNNKAVAFESKHEPIEPLNLSKTENINNNKNIASSPPLSPMTKAFTQKYSRETFEQTRSRLHAIFQYEKYKVGQRRSSLPTRDKLTNDAERLEFVKSIILSSMRRPSSWSHSTPSLLQSTTSSSKI